MALRWSDFILPSTLQLAPLLEVLIEPVCCRKMQGQVQLGLHEALVNAVRHGNGCDPAKYLRVRRIDLLRPMLTGDKILANHALASKDNKASRLLAGVLLLLCALTVGLVVGSSPL